MTKPDWNTPHVRAILQAAERDRFYKGWQIIAGEEEKRERWEFQELTQSWEGTAWRIDIGPTTFVGTFWKLERPTSFKNEDALKEMTIIVKRSDYEDRFRLCGLRIKSGLIDLLDDSGYPVTVHFDAYADEVLMMASPLLFRQVPDVMRESTKNPTAFYYAHLACFQDKYGKQYTGDVLASKITGNRNVSFTPMSSADLLGDVPCVYCHRPIQKEDRDAEK